MHDRTRSATSAITESWWATKEWPANSSRRSKKRLSNWVWIDTSRALTASSAINTSDRSPGRARPRRVDAVPPKVRSGGAPPWTPGGARDQGTSTRSVPSSLPVVMDATGLENRRTDRHSRMSESTGLGRPSACAGEFRAARDPGVANAATIDRDHTLVWLNQRINILAKVVLPPRATGDPESRPWRDRNSRDRPPARCHPVGASRTPPGSDAPESLGEAWTLSSVSLTRTRFAVALTVRTNGQRSRGPHPRLETHVDTAHSGRAKAQRLANGHPGPISPRWAVARMPARRTDGRPTRDSGSTRATRACTVLRRAHISSTGPASTT